MKKLILAFAVLLTTGFMACNNGGGKVTTDVVKNDKSAQGDKNTGDLPAITFQETEHDFGKIIQGEKVSYSFKFTNTGGSALLISRVSTSCGCTVSKYPKVPIQPGESEFIEATFDSTHKKGYQNKAITVLANTQPNKTVVRIKAQVVLPQNN